jgi:hypothetical protein
MRSDPDIYFSTIGEMKATGSRRVEEENSKVVH